jgi:hypothetical protein
MIRVLWVVTLCRWANTSRSFELLWCLHLQVQAVEDLQPEDEGTAILPYVENCLPKDTAQNPRRHESLRQTWLTRTLIYITHFKVKVTL